MLTGVKNNLRIFCLNIKYSVMRELLNKASFIMNIVFMILNNASFILLWVLFYSIKDNIGGCTLNDILLLWGLGSGTFGVSHILFDRAFELNKFINNGKLDAYLVQPKNVLLQAICDVQPSAFGDLIYGYIAFFLSGAPISKIFLFTLFNITGGIILAAVSIIFSSLAFWFGNTEMIVSQAQSLMTQFAIYPEGIFNNIIKTLFFTILPVAFTAYIPLSLLNAFNLSNLLIVLGATALIVGFAFLIFYRGLKRYCSSNLMIARV